MSTVNNIRVTDRTHDAANSIAGLLNRPPKQQVEYYIGPPINQLNKLNLQRQQIALALISSLQVPDSSELYQSIRTTIL